MLTLIMPASRFSCQSELLPLLQARWQTSPNELDAFLHRAHSSSPPQTMSGLILSNKLCP